MKILVYGAGVLGCNLARNLFRAGKDVTLLARGNWAEEIRETLNKSSASGRRIFCPIRAVLKAGNTQSIPPLSELSAEPKSSAISSCRFNQSFLRKNGLRIKDKFSPRTSVSRIPVVTELAPDDRYDVIFVVLRYTQLDSALDTLRTNRTKNIVFVGNNVQTRALAAALPEKNVLFAFALSAGHRGLPCHKKSGTQDFAKGGRKFRERKVPQNLPAIFQVDVRHLAGQALRLRPRHERDRRNEHPQPGYQGIL